MYENKIFFYIYFFATFQRKLDTLKILYFYSTKIPTNINQNGRKIRQKITNFLEGF